MSALRRRVDAINALLAESDALARDPVARRVALVAAMDLEAELGLEREDATARARAFVEAALASRLTTLEEVAA